MDFTRGDQPAFPVPNDGAGGMTMREYFAGKALQGMLAGGQFVLFPKDDDDIHAVLAARNAFALADAMVAEARRKHDDMEAMRLAPRVCNGCGHRGTAEDFIDENIDDACPRCGGPSSPVKKGE